LGVIEKRIKEDFLGLSDKYSEKDLESTILAELQHNHRTG